MNLDVRFPIGLMFTVVGALLTLFGFGSDPKIYERSLNINVNLWWGLVMLVFGLVMLVFGWRAQRAAAKAQPKAPRELEKSGR